MLVLFAFVLTSCAKYDDGGLIRKADKRISSTKWKLSKYIRNETDETADLLVTNFVEEYADDGSLVRTYTDDTQQSQTQNGTWELDADKAFVIVSGVGSVEFTTAGGTATSSQYTILKLKADEFWYSYENGGDLHEFHFVPMN